MAHVDPGFSADRNPRLPMLATYLALVRSNIAIVIVTTLIGGALGYYLASRVPPEFKASAFIELSDVPTYVDPQPASPSPDRTTIDTTAQLVMSTPVFERVAAKTSLTVAEVSSQLSVSAYPLSRVLIIGFEAKTADLAIRGANEAAQALIDQRTAVLAGAQLESANTLYDRLISIRSKVAARVAKFSPVARKISLVLDQINDLKRDSIGYGGLIVKDAYPAKSVNEHPELQVVTGIVLGLMVGVMVSWWRPIRRRKIDRRRADRRVIGVR